jgi:hypothetical protein
MVCEVVWKGEKMTKQHIVIHNEAELLAYLDYQIYGPYAESLPPVRFSEEMIKASQFKMLPTEKDKEG